jgi:hypothetical protein
MIAAPPTPVAHAGDRPDIPEVPDVPMERAWGVAGWIGLVLAIGGALDLALVWFPPHWSTPDWRFGAVAESAALLPWPTLGVAALAGAALAGGRKRALRAVGGLLVVVGLLLVAGYGLFVLDARPLLLAVRGDDPIAALSLRRIVAKTTATMVLLGPGLFTVGVTTLRAGFARRPGAPR